MIRPLGEPVFVFFTECPEAIESDFTISSKPRQNLSLLRHDGGAMQPRFMFGQLAWKAGLDVSAFAMV